MFEFKLPDLGEGVHEGQIVNVLVKEGDQIAEFQPMLEIETDKAAVEIPSPKSGVVAKVHVQPGQTVKVGQVLLAIEEGGGDGRPAAPPSPTQATARAEPPPKEAPPPPPPPRPTEGRA
ncbi:MAG: biotin/lipoyl-containing protein, partial [Planctomycetota bacterium]